MNSKKLKLGKMDISGFRTSQFNQDCEPGSSTPSTPVPDQKYETESEYDEGDLEIEEPATRVLRSSKAVQHVDPEPSDQKSKNSDVPQTDLTKNSGLSTIRCRK